jgi:hypothetical protein
MTVATFQALGGNPAALDLDKLSAILAEPDAQKRIKMLDAEIDATAKNANQTPARRRSRIVPHKPYRYAMPRPPGSLAPYSEFLALP